MSLAVKRELRAAGKAKAQHPLVHIAVFFSATLFVLLLIKTYGLDLSPGLF